MTTPVARQSSVHPKNVLETPKIPTSGVKPRIFREKDFIHTSAKLVHSFLTEKGYPKPIILKSLLNPESYEVLNIFSYLLSFLDSQLASEIRVKEDIPNVLAFIGYPYTIKKSTISALNTPHNWPSILASIRFIVERLEEVLPHDLGIDILFPPASFSEDAGSNKQFKENVIRNSVGKKSRQTLSYPSIPSVIRPVPHSDRLPPLVFSGFAFPDDEETELEREEIVEMEYQKIDTESESEDSFCETRVTVQQFNQSELNDLVRDLDLPKQAAELLASRLKEKQVLDRSVKVSSF
ncbi:Kinetochore protein NDC80-like [Oopsacas minuta]|uniref:Kinetochore protein NDC80 n=1 Tax=Oopsacas minuta TaxID=111878 RepID=A0AAV7KHH5_9METZ|nr:Kinetochore protein NDC80-like [Oopsacas minuta]